MAKKVPRDPNATRVDDRVLNPLGDTRLRMEAVANARGLRGGSRFVRACRDRQVRRVRK